MLEMMRKNAGSWIIKVMLFGIVIVFAFWGTANYTQRDANTVIKIGNVRVPYSEYRDMYNNLYQSVSDSVDRVDRELLAALDLENQTIEALKDRYLLLEAAREMGITVTDEEIAASIAATEAFQSVGIFSPQLYQTFLSINQLTADRYEDIVAADITVAKMTELIGLSARVTDQEVDEDLELLTTLAAVKILELTPNLFINQVAAPTEEDLLDHYETNAELFRVPEQFQVVIAVLDPLDRLDRITVPDEEVEDWYEDNEDDYTVPAAYSVRHILFAFPADASADSINQIREQAEEAAARIREGEISFEDAAARWSDDVGSAASGGDLGILEEPDMESSLFRVIEDLEEGELSGPIPTSRGFEIIRLDARRPERLRPLGEVRDRIERTIRLEKAKEITLDTVDDLLDRAEETGTSLKELAEERGIIVITSPRFTRDNSIRLGGDLPGAIFAAALRTEEGETIDVVEEEGKYYIAQTVLRSEPRIPDLEEIREDVKASWLIERALDAALTRGEELVEELEKGRELTALARRVGAGRILTPEPFTVLDTRVQDVDDPEAVVDAAFSLDEPGTAALAEGSRSHYIVVLEEKITVTEEEREQTRPLVREALEEQRRKEVLEGYLTGLRTKFADQIWVNPDFV